MCDGGLGSREGVNRAWVPLVTSLVLTAPAGVPHMQIIAWQHL